MPLPEWPRQLQTRVEGGTAVPLVRFVSSSLTLGHRSRAYEELRAELKNVPVYRTTALAKRGVRHDRVVKRRASSVL